MVQTIERLAHIHFEHLIWSNELQNIRAEIGIFLKRLDVLLTQYAATTLHDELIDFKRNFELIKMDIDEWQVAIGAHEFHISELAQLNGALTHMSNSQHEDIRNKLHSVRRTMLKLKEAFQYFLVERIR